MYGYIYLTTNLINNKKYIGRHKASIFDIGYQGSGKIIKEAINKYGRKNFSTTILEECETKEQLFEQEKYWIKYYNAVLDTNYYNIDEGGSGPLEVPEDVKIRLSKAFSGDKNPAKRPEVRQKISEKLSGENNPMKRQDVKDKVKLASALKSAEEKQVIVNKILTTKLLKNNGQYVSEETREKISNGKKGKHLSESQRNNISKSLTGIKRTNEQKQHYRDGAKKRTRSSGTGTHWFNNGINNIRTKECPEGFIPGKIDKKHIFKDK